MRIEKLRTQQTGENAKNKEARPRQPTAERRGMATADDVLNGDSPRSRVPRTWRWHYGVLLALQSRLLRERAGALRRAAEPLESHSLSPADSASDEFDHNLALSELSAEQDALYEVEEALSRILDGTYGVCEETGQPIPAARLRAVPWTRFARVVEERLERAGEVNRTHLTQAASVRDKKRR